MEGGGGGEEEKKREVEGDLIRHIHYRMQFVTPVGPPVTRVHRIQRWYAHDRKAGGGGEVGRVVARLDSCSVTPDIMFGDVVLILERMYVEQVSEGGVDGVGGMVKVRVMGGVRFRSRPWRMKPFIGLIQQRSRDDAKKGAEDWEAWSKKRMHDEPDKVERAALKVQRLRGKKGLEQLLASSQRLSSAAVPQSKEQQPQQSATASRSAPSVTPPSSSSSLPSLPSLPSAAAAVTSSLQQPAATTALTVSSPPQSWTALLSLQSLQAAWRETDHWHRAAAVTLMVAVLFLLVLGVGSSGFVLSCLCSLLLLHWGGLHRLQRLQDAVDVNRAEVQAVAQLLSAVKVELDKAQAEERENRKRKVSNVLLDPDHFPAPPPKPK